MNNQNGYRSSHEIIFHFDSISMFFREILVLIILLSVTEQQKPDRCLTGYMTDVQTWVNEEGALTPTVDLRYSIDLSSQVNPVPHLQQQLNLIRSSPERRITYLSLAKCQLTRVPPIFNLRELPGRMLANSVEYITFYGNDFTDVSPPGEQYEMSLNATDAKELTVDMAYKASEATSLWSGSLRQSYFPSLQEIDFRSCQIRVLGSNIFKGMPNLKALYLGENEIHHIDENAFIGLGSLRHLDFSRNKAYDSRGNLKGLVPPTFFLFRELTNLTSLDLSFTKFNQRNTDILNGLSPKLQRLSICDTGLNRLPRGVFRNTSLRFLDVSGNTGILNQNIFENIEDTLQVVYANEVGLTNMDMFAYLYQLEVLKLSHNEINIVHSDVTSTWSKLQILDLDFNRLTAWFDPMFSKIPNLKYLSLKNNNINIISEEMILDVSKVKYLAMSGNFIVCSCHTRDFLELAARAETNHTNTRIVSFNSTNQRYNFHTGFGDFNKHINMRLPVIINGEYSPELDIESNFILVDYEPTKYQCLAVATSVSTSFGEVPGCHSLREIDYDNVVHGNINKLYALFVIPCILLPLLLIFIFRRNLIYCCITLRNSAMLSMINQKETIDEVTIFHYDVFVSYCNEDRGWVLDHLLPQLESDCSISACLHERDFQVGLSILENIVSCMDRSRSIMLVISQRFLMSQWCQFEMHLAQHRLLETRREDLTLVLLEEIPRRLRPTTLHYLMLTKTYIVWPKADAERALFWKRLKKSLITHRLKQAENASLA